MKYKSVDENISESSVEEVSKEKEINSMESVCENLMHVVNFRLNLIKESVNAIEQALENIKKLHETNN